jgi:hypothetical protein
MSKEAARSWRWLVAVVIRFWGWVGGLATAIFVLDYIPALQPLVDRL